MNILNATNTYGDIKLHHHTSGKILGSGNTLQQLYDAICDIGKEPHVLHLTDDKRCLEVHSFLFEEFIHTVDKSIWIIVNPFYSTEAVIIEPDLEFYFYDENGQRHFCIKTENFGLSENATEFYSNFMIDIMEKIKKTNGFTDRNVYNIKDNDIVQ